MDQAVVGRVLFGRPTRLSLGLWVLALEKDRFFQSEPPRSLGAQSAVVVELGKFVQLGLLDEERPPGDKRVFYVRTHSLLWAVFAAARDGVAAMGAAQK